MSNAPISTDLPQWDLADRLRKALRHSGISVQGMADELEVDRSTVGNYINGHTKPPASAVMRWALLTGFPYPWLKSGEVESEGDGGPGGGGLPAQKHRLPGYGTSRTGPSTLLLEHAA